MSHKPLSPTAKQEALERALKEIRAKYGDCERMCEMSFGRRNTDWQAWGQHRRRATARMAQKSREREIEEYQARFERPAEKKEEEKK